MLRDPSIIGTAEKHQTGLSRQPLVAAISLRSHASDELITAMYRLYSRNYLDATWPIFKRDLAAKTHIVELKDSQNRLCGFSTLQLYDSSAGPRRARVLYSGDTIVDPQYWGSSALALEWLRFAGHVQRREPKVPLYWLLIVKGHRTYRFLPTFAKHYVPHHSQPGAAAETELLNALAIERFGTNFDPRNGIVRFASPQGRLNSALAEIPARHLRLPSVAYFLKRNPGYRNGDELVCLCELSSTNLRPMAQRAFESARVDLQLA